MYITNNLTKQVLPHHFSILAYILLQLPSFSSPPSPHHHRREQYSDGKPDQTSASFKLNQMYSVQVVLITGCQTDTKTEIFWTNLCFQQIFYICFWPQTDHHVKNVQTTNCIHVLCIQNM